MITLKQILGILILLGLGFLAHCLFVGLSVEIYLVFKALSAWQLMIGSVLWSILIFIWCLKKESKK